jgi:hypothetical protein
MSESEAAAGAGGGKPRPRPRASNVEIADVLDRVADLLEAQDADVFRVRAWRRAAESVRGQPEAVAALAEAGGAAALDALPGVGRSLAAAILEVVRTGSLGFLERLEGEVSAEDLFTTVPGIAGELAHRIHASLGIQTLEDLEIAAHDGRLATVQGFGPRRVRAVREALASMLARSSRRRARRARWLAAGRGAPGGGARPDVAALLSVDREYRERAERGDLRTIAPRRMNPDRAAWLPVLHTRRGAWSFTALFSNTERAHALGRERDWVVLYYERDGDQGQCTVVTERSGPLAGRRVVRGREAECAAAPAA